MWAHSAVTAGGINDAHKNPRYLVDYELPSNVSATCDIASALEGADGVIFAVPSAHLRAMAHETASYIAKGTPVL